LDYRNFLEFSLSLFQFDDCSIPERKLCFLAEPDVPEISFERDMVQRQLPTITGITDGTPPGAIQDPKLRALYIFYLSKKEKLVEKDGAVYDDVYTHHGRDVIHEVLASVFGQLLGVPVPLNYFGHRHPGFNMASGRDFQNSGPDIHRYVLSKAVQDTHPSPFLVDVLHKKFRDLNIVWGLSLFREQSNPLGLQFFQDRETTDPGDLGNLIIAECRHHTDLILSDFLDRLLGGWKDRKPYDYLVPQGLQGPIFTVDFGEILFPELMFDTEEPHYVAQRQARASTLKDYLRQIGELSPDNPYRKTIAGLIPRIREIDLPLIGRLVNAIPETFLMDHFEKDLYCYQTASVIDFLENQFTIIMEQNDI
jgi:hypothetical protein